jgi:hypothetical protein
MSSYVEQYRRLEEQAVDADSRVEQYQARAEQHRWEQCRIAHEAIESGEWSRRSFGDAVGRADTHIGRQWKMWERWGASRASHRPSYSDSYNEVTSDSSEAKTSRRDLSGARQVLSDRKLAREVLSDPDIARKLMADDHIRAGLSRTSREIDAHRAAKVSRQQRESAPKLAEAKEYYEALSRLTHARQDARQALDLLRGLPPLDPDRRTEVRQELDWLQASMDWLRETVKARRAATLSDEIESFLAEQS